MNSETLMLYIFKFSTLVAGVLIAGAVSAHAASFDCEQADLAADEQAICDNRDLNDADVKMVTTFELLSGLFAMGNRGTLQDEQVEWLTSRGTCEGDVDCLRKAYALRLEQLRSAYDSLPRPL